MRTGTTLSALDKQGRIRVYSRYSTVRLLRTDPNDHYILLRRNLANIGPFAQFPNLTQRALLGANEATWDQPAVPFTVLPERLDALPHPKFTASSLPPSDKVMALHGPDWFTLEYAKFRKPKMELAIMGEAGASRASARCTVPVLTAKREHLRQGPGNEENIRRIVVTDEARVPTGRSDQAVGRRVS